MSLPARVLSKEELERYSRNILLPEMGVEGQRRLARSHVFVVGCGGLGSPVLLYLAAAGVGQLSFIDRDCVEISNLQRQVLFTTADVGKPKAYCAAERLRALNPHVHLLPYVDALRPENISEYLSDCDVVVETSDNFPTKFLVNDAAVLFSKPAVMAGILRFEGQLMSVAPGKSACYRCLFRAPPPTDSVPSCSEAGVLGTVAGIIGALQAAEVLKIISGHGQPLYNQLLRADLQTSSFRNVTIPRRSDCEVCGDKADITSITAGAYGSLPVCSIR